MKRKLASIKFDDKKKIGVIYRITNMLNNKKYIGKRELPKEEFLNSIYYGSGKIIKLAIKKYGIENFKREIICEAEFEILPELEKKYIFEEETLIPIGYNIQNGGGGGDNGIRHRTFTNEWKQNISNSCKGREAWNKGLSKKKDERMQNVGKKFTDEEKRNISESLKGINRSAETRQKISSSMKMLYDNGYINYQNYQKRKNSTVVDKGELNKLIQKGSLLKDIAKHFNISFPTVSAKIKEYWGVKNLTEARALL